jgi:uncharacterized repeat protein (TIGR03803 family)
MRKPICPAYCSILGLLAPLTLHAATLTSLHSFGGGTDAALPNGTLTYYQGELYGVSLAGGANGKGAVYSVNATTGAETVIYSFKGGEDGAAPWGNLVYRNGTLFGTTSQGGAHGAGTVFAVNIAKGSEVRLHNFAGKPDGSDPVAGLVYLNGMLYGTTKAGGAFGAGTLFDFDFKSGLEQVVYSFGANVPDGGSPESSLIAVEGALYGTTFYADSTSTAAGAIYKFNTTTKTESLLYSFTGKYDGGGPIGGLIYSNGLLYGTTSCLYGSCQNGLYGTIFSLNPSTGTLTTLNDFTEGAGVAPLSSLVAYNKAVIGVASGVNYSGPGAGMTIFATPEAYLGAVVLYTFSPGEFSYTGLVSEGDTFYGTTFNTVFKLKL